MFNRLQHNVRWILSIFVVLTLIAIATGGYYYNRHIKYEAHLRQASHHYTQLTQINDNQEPSAISIDKAQIFIQEYADTPYAALLNLQLAQQSIHHHEWEKALQWLQKATQAKDPDIRCIAIQRTARVLAAIGKKKEALNLLEDINHPAYIASTEEIKGDILHALKDNKKALEAYHNAAQTTPEATAMRPLLQMKINDLRHLEKANPRS